MTATPVVNTATLSQFQAPRGALKSAHEEVNSMLNTLIARMYLAARREEGQAMAEYGIILALIAVVAIATLVLLGGKINSALTDLTSQLK